MPQREPECVALKRRGQEYVGRLLAAMSREEQLQFWNHQTESLREWQRAKRSGTTDLDPTTCLLLEDSRAESG